MEESEILNIKLADVPLNDLKVLAYDQLAEMERCQKNIQIINQEISKRLSSTIVTA